MSGRDEWPALCRVRLVLCADCLAGVGGECHTPGCALWMKRAPNISFVDWCEEFEVLEPGEETRASGQTAATTMFELEMFGHQEEEGQ